MYNSIRRRKAKRGEYPVFCEETVGTDQFYQFALDPIKVIEKIENNGFRLKYRGGLSSLKCVNDEYPVFGKSIRLINKIPYGVGSKISVIVDLLLGRHLGHSSLLIFQNIK